VGFAKSHRGATQQQSVGKRDGFERGEGKKNTTLEAEKNFLRVIHVGPLLLCRLTHPL